MKNILKFTLEYSNNYVADNLGDFLARRISPQAGSDAQLSGAKALEKALIINLGIASDEISLSSTSGLFVNRITPGAELKVLRALEALLANNPLVPGEHLKLADVMAVAGVDPGTLHKRFRNEAGTVIAKTGTLPDTDGGVSALVGQAGTARDGNLLFVIFEKGVGRPGIRTSRRRQEQIVKQMQIAHGGPRQLAR